MRRGGEVSNVKKSYSNREDIKGMKSYYLTVIEHVYGSKWKCLCECGNYRVLYKHEIKRRKIKSCGCMRGEFIRQARKTKRSKNLRLYKIYDGMKQRCLNENDTNYHNYGGRGITICGDWLSDYKNFYNWAINNGYESHLTIDRVDVNGDYNPNNCRWVDWDVQSSNKRNTIRVKVKGELLTIQELSEKYNLNENALYYRYYEGIRGDNIIKASGYFVKNRRKKNV